jgi:dTDP-4-amino-4,6-dideoxygalactose transaminase
MEIPFHKTYTTDDEIYEVTAAIKSGWTTMGPKTFAFEEDFRNFVGSGHAVAVNSGTAALHLALKVIGLSSSDEVIIPTMTFTATGEVVCYHGARPVIVDVDRDTHNISIKCIEKAISSKTRAIIPVHFGGQPCDMDEILEIAKKKGIFVIEDAAHAIPAAYKGRKIGTIGDLTCFSFYATKTLATGEGGMVTTENTDWTDRIRRLRLHGISKDAWNRYSKEGSWYYEVIEAGYKYNMTDIQAGLGLAQLRKVEWMKERRREIAAKYTDAFKSLEGIITPTIKPGNDSAWHLYVIKLNLEALNINRNEFIENLHGRGISTSVHFIPLHMHPFYREGYSLDSKDFPGAEWLFERIISLPIYPGLNDSEVAYIVENVRDVCRQHKR